MRRHQEIAKEAGGSVAPSLVLGIQIEVMERALEIVEARPILDSYGQMNLSKPIEDSLRHELNSLRRMR